MQRGRLTHFGVLRRWATSAFCAAMLCVAQTMVIESPYQVRGLSQLDPLIMQNSSPRLMQRDITSSSQFLLENTNSMRTLSGPLILATPRSMWLVVAAGTLRFGRNPNPLTRG